MPQDPATHIPLHEADVLVEKSKRALAACHDKGRAVQHLCVAGGVAANTVIRNGLNDLCNDADISFIAPPLSLCTDNAAMIAFAAIEQSRSDQLQNEGNEIVARPRWPLDAVRPSGIGHGKKGAKA